MTQIKRSEWLWVAVFGVLVLALTCVPYIVGALRSDDALRFSGFVIGVEDGNSYIAKMQLGAHGQWLFQLAYAVEEHPQSLMFLFYILLGKLIGAVVGTSDALRLHDALVFGFHVARVLFGIAMIAVMYRFLAELLPRVRQRRLALIAAVLGGGLGWLLVMIPKMDQPLEFYSPEAFSFLHLYGLPHLSAVRVFMLGGLLFYLRAVRGRWLWAFAAGSAWFVMTLIQPFYMIIVYVILVMHIAILAVLAFRQRDGELVRGVDVGAAAVRALWVSALAGAFGLPLVLYTFLLFMVDPIYQTWGLQNVILSPSIIHYVSAWGLVALLGLFGLRSLFRRNLVAWALVLGWLIVMPGLLYAPYNLQRRFSEGIFVPLVGLAMLGLTVGIGKGWLRRLVSRYGPLVLIAVSLPATGLVWVGGMIAATQSRAPVFQPRDLVATYAFLGRSLPPRAVVASSYQIGNAIPAYGHLVAYIGHGPETPALEFKRGQVSTFFARTTLDVNRRDIYYGMGVPYVIIGPEERTAGFDPVQQAGGYLQMIFESGEYSVWSLK